MQKETNTVIVIEEVGDQGVVQISSENKDSIDKAVARIRAITATPEIGEVYHGKVKSIVAFGAFVEILPGKDGLLHISEIDHRRIETMEGVLKEGDMIDVKLIDVDKKTGKFKLSRKALIPKPESAN
jgi:polyribonucleotide nucleotidyltransferase